MPAVLLADDDAVLREMYKMRLTREGYIVHEAIDGQDTIAKAESTHPDIILLDVMMPRMNGLDALKILKSGQSTKNIPVIILTALAQDLSQLGADDMRAEDYITKSETIPDQVVEKVKTVLEQHKKTAPPKDKGSTG